MEHSVQVQVSQGIATITLNRPDKLNAFTSEMLASLQKALLQVEQTPSIRAVILTANGKAFSAGQDLADPLVQFTDAGQAPDLETVVLDHYRPLILQLHRLRVPTVCAVNGIAAGAGASLAFACDIIVAQESAVFLQAFSKIGLIPDSGGSWNLVHRLGIPRAIGLAMLGDKLPAQQARDMGLIWEVVGDENLQQRALELAQKLAQMPTKALVATRHVIHAAATNDLATQLDLEAHTMGLMAQTADFAEGVKAFQDKRPPHFIGA